MLQEKLTDYAKSDVYPFHMPGHKRRSIADISSYKIDITEIDGFDNLHHAKEILKQVHQKAAELYGSKECFYLINGSTCGILAAISAAVGRNEKILVARNSHKSVYHGLFLRQLKAEYVYPVETKLGIQGQITKEQIEQKLRKEPDIKAVFITSPTYDGVVSDIEGIAQVVHKYQIPLIVDSAHGAHFGFSKGFPQNAVKLGADIVIESVHKTLPAFTQTALLHVCSERVSLDKIKKYLSIYETSSPSYILMAGIDVCMEFLKKEGTIYFEKFEENLRLFYEKVSSLKYLKVIRKCDFEKEDAFDFDESKILIFNKNAKANPHVSGAYLQNILLEKYSLQMEMACGNYTLALSSIMDTKEGFDRLAEALLEIDVHLEGAFERNTSCEAAFQYPLYGNGFNQTKESFQQQNIYKMQKKNIEIFEAQEMESISVPLEESIGKIAADYIYLYPPGIPILVPGEEITKIFVEDIKACQEKGLEVEGLSEDGKMSIVDNCYI